MSATANRRILVIDDTVSIHEDFRRILCGADDAPAPCRSVISGVIKPKSMVRTLPPPEENLRHAANESRTPRRFRARAKSFPLPQGTTRTGSRSLTNCAK